MCWRVVKRHPKQNLASRQVKHLKKAPAPKTKAAKKQPAVAKLEPSVEDINLLELSSPKLAGPTNEKNSRCELTAHAQLASGEWKRVHVWTATVSKWGDSLHDDMLSIANSIRAGGQSKAKCLEKRDKLKEVLLGNT